MDIDTSSWIYDATIQFENIGNNNKVFHLVIYKTDGIDSNRVYREESKSWNRVVEVLSEYGLEDDFEENDVPEIF